MQGRVSNRAVFGWFWLLNWAFICYGSLIPFDYQGITLDTALTRFARIPTLVLGLESRIDWLANLILYAPLTLFGALWLSGGKTFRQAPVAVIGGILLASAWSLLTALGIEFAQLYFPARTVSMNDLIAEGLGTATGAGIALIAGNRLFLLIARARSISREEASVAAVALYGLIYVAVSLFPFDFSAAAVILAQKLRDGQASWWLSASQSEQGLLVYLKLVAEAIAFAPFGYWAGRRWPSRGPTAAALGGLAAGSLIEILQLFLMASTSQGASAIARALGATLAAWLATRENRIARWATPSRRRVLALTLSAPWFAGVLYLAGWGRSAVNLTDIPTRLDAVRWTPFVYHYFTNEAVALVSVLAIGGAYAWVGLAGPLISRHTATWAWPTLAFLIAAAVEASKLILAMRHPDPTNALIAAAAAYLMATIWQRFTGLRSKAGSRSKTAPEEIKIPLRRLQLRAQEESQTPELPAPLLAATLGITSAILIRLYPNNTVALATAALLCVVAVWRHPASAFMIVAIHLGLSDVVRYTGNRVWEPLDTLMVAVLIGALASREPPGNGTPIGGHWIAALSILTTIGIARGLAGADMNDPDLLFSRMGPFNALILAKGAVWAMALQWLLSRGTVRGANALTQFAVGLTIALAGVSALTIMERSSFLALGDFTSPHRAAGPFSAISTGGAYIEGFLAAAVPFGIACAVLARHWLGRVASVGTVVLAAYATMITYSRAGQVMFLLCAAATLAVALRSARSTSPGTTTQPASRTMPDGWWSRFFWPLAIAGLIALVAVPVLVGGFSTWRFTQVSQDSDTRVEHWRKVAKLIGDNPLDWLLGRGIARLPMVAYLESSADERPALFSRQRESGNHYLRVSPGMIGYLDQTLSASVSGLVRMTLRARSGVPGASFSVMLCEKDLVQSVRCDSRMIQPPPDGKWHVVDAALELDRSATSTRWPRAHQVISLASGSLSIDIDDVQARDVEDAQLIANGGFENALGAWYYVSDAHLAWHAKNLLLHLGVEHGLLGALFYLAMALVAFQRLLPALKSRSIYQVALGSAIAAFLGIGLIDSLIDSPRFSQLFLMLLLLAMTPIRQKL